MRVKESESVWVNECVRKTKNVCERVCVREGVSKTEVVGYPSRGARGLPKTPRCPPPPPSSESGV